MSDSYIGLFLTNILDHQEAKLTGLLLKYFNKPSFKEWQLRVIAATLEAKNTLVVKPTGSGKSLCYQFPAVVTGKLTVVLTPTISLIMDQVHHLQDSGLRITHLGTMQTDRNIITKITQQDHHIIFCTPESFYDSLGEPKSIFKSLAVQNKIGLIAVDEAHLLKSWRTFR